MTAGEHSGPKAAVHRVARRARQDRSDAADRLEALGVDLRVAQRTIDDVRLGGRLTLNFHPDRLDATGRSVAAGLLADGRYRSQFETGISNGGRFAVAGGARTRWETLLFGDAYDSGYSPRPVYGALDLFEDPFGGCPRFGSTFIVLERTCLERATFCMGDSHLDPRDVGTADQLLPRVAGAVEACTHGDGFGRNLSVGEFIKAIGPSRRRSPSSRELDCYVEAQIHGPVSLVNDVAALHLDPSFVDTEVHQDLEAAAGRYGFELAWSEGPELLPAAIHPDFRGPEVVALAKRTARQDGRVDAAAIGRAMVDLPFTPPSVEGDAEISPRQRYKKLWHCCLKFGTPP